MNLPHLIRFIVLFACVAALFAPAVFAQTPITIDTTFLTPDTNASSVPQFISKFYELGLGIAGIIAVGMIVVGAIFYTISGASPQKKGEAKDIIFSAIWGVVLLFGSYVILKSINPQLIELRDPGSGLGGELPSPMDTGSCASSTPYTYVTNPQEIDQTKWNYETIGTLESNNKKCPEGDSPIDPATGLCRCYLEDIREVVCPAEYEPKRVSVPYPNYSWTTNDGILSNSVATTDQSINGCPRKVTIPGGPFRTIDCDPCENSWADAGDDDWHYQTEQVLGLVGGQSIDTIGWVWPYYPKNWSGPATNDPNPENDPAKNPGKGAVCVLYAHYDPIDKEIERSDLDGLKPCTKFSATTTRFYSFTYGGTGTGLGGGNPLPLNVGILDSSIPSKSACGPNGVPANCACIYPQETHASVCMVNSTLNNKLKTLAQTYSGWRVTEAYPPTVQHNDACHNNGTCVDIAITSTPTCTNVQEFIDKVKAAGMTVVNEYYSLKNTCPNLNPTPTRYETTTGGHLHVK